MIWNQLNTVREKKTKHCCETWRIEGVGVTQEALEEVGVSPPRLLRRSDRFRTWVDCQLGIILDRYLPGP